MNYLEHILKQKREEIEYLLLQVKSDPNHPIHTVLSRNIQKEKTLENALKSTSLTVIAEVKRQSPSLGKIPCHLDLAQLALEYCRGGASAVSVLTDSVGFGGSLQDLRSVSEILKREYPSVSLLRKDFILHPIQLAEAAASGASVVLLITSILGKELPMFLKEASRLGLETITEVHNEKELALAIESHSPIVGINRRNLATFQIDRELCKKLRPKIPASVLTIAESGVQDADEARELHSLGYHGVLVGERLVKDQDPASCISAMKGDFHES